MNNDVFMKVTITYPGRLKPWRMVTERVTLSHLWPVYEECADLLRHTGGVSVPDYLEFMEAITRAEAVMDAEPEAYMTVTHRVDGEEVDAVITRTEEDLLLQVDKYTVKTDPGEDDYIYNIHEWISDLIVSLIKEEV